MFLYLHYLGHQNRLTGNDERLSAHHHRRHSCQPASQSIVTNVHQYNRMNWVNRLAPVSIIVRTKSTKSTTMMNWAFGASFVAITGPTTVVIRCNMRRQWWLCYSSVEYKSNHCLTKLALVLVHGHPRVGPLHEVLGPLGHGIRVLDDLLLQYYNALLCHPIPQYHGLGDSLLPQWLSTRVPISSDPI
jgi:hypothetical protein